MSNGFAYFEDVAATGMTCPHEDAFEPDGVKVYYRYIKGNAVSSDSFLPTALNPALPPPDACIQKSVSVYDSLDGLQNGVFKLPHNKGKKKLIGLVKLSTADGVLKRTFGPGHHSWWRARAFDVTTVIIQEIQL